MGFCSSDDCAREEGVSTCDQQGGGCGRYLACSCGLQSGRKEPEKLGFDTGVRVAGVL